MYIFPQKGNISEDPQKINIFDKQGHHIFAASKLMLRPIFAASQR
jgi:hypothetical protein